MIRIQQSYFSNIRNEMVEFIPEKYKYVLEVGCGEGLFKRHLHADAEYWGIDPSEAVFDQASANCHAFVKGTLENSVDAIPDDYFDLIILNDVIEHSADHELFLFYIKRKLKNDGHIIGSVPNVRYIKNLYSLLISKSWEYDYSGGILDYTHLRFFTFKSLKKFFQNANMEICLFKGINPIWNSKFTIRKIIKKILFFPVMLLFGNDIVYMQFGFRVKNKYQSKSICLEKYPSL